MLKRSMIISAVASLMAIAGVSSGLADPTLDKLKDAGVVRLGIAPEPPYAVVNADGGLSGADPDIAREVFGKLGVSKLESNVVDWGALIPGLMAGRFDVVSTGLFVRPERCKAVAFSQPLLCTAEAFLVKKGNPLQLKSYQDLVDKGARISAVGGGAEEKHALQIGVPRDKVLGVSDIFNAVELIQGGRVDALGFPDITLQAVLTKIGNDKFELVSPLPNEPIQCASAAFNPQSRGLRDLFDQEVDKMKQSGRFDEILKSYGFNPTLASQVTRKDLCEGDN